MSVYNFAETIVAGSSAQGGSGVVEQSLKFNSGEASYLTRTPSSAGNRKTWTWSAWVKRGNLGLKRLFTAGTSGSSYLQIRFDTNDEILCSSEQPSTVLYLKTTQKFRDTSAWYHLVLVMDTTQSTAADRTKLYVNGSLVTDFSSTTRPSQNTDLLINSTTAHMIGALSYGATSDPYDGYLSDVHFIDGQALSPTSFGETIDNSWKKIDYTGTYGTNGFKLNFQDDVVSEGFNTVTWKGNSPLSQSISGLGFSPDLVWIKSRSQTYNHVLVDTVRGQGKDLYSNTTGAQTSTSSELISFDADGFSVGSGGSANDPTGSLGFVAWCWDAGSGSAASNTDGSITSTVKANPGNGFSIVKWVGDGTSQGATVGHSLGVTPSMIIVKSTDSTAGWNVWHEDLTNATTSRLVLNDTDDEFDSVYVWGSTAPDNSAFGVGTVGTTTWTNRSSRNYIAYCFAEVAGYSSIGTYSGTDSAGVTVTTGFRPAFVMIKATNIAENWVIIDNTRNPANPANSYLNPNTTSAEGSSSAFDIDFTNTGFVLQGTDDAINGYSGGTGEYIYMAFADTREAAFFKDVSGQGNHFAPQNLDYRDSMIDSPSNNFATLNPLDNYNTGATLSEGNLKWTIGGADGASRSTYVMTTGKWYVEFLSNNDYIGVVSGNASIVNMNGTQTVYYAQDGTKRVNGSGSSYGASYADGDIIGIALDLDASTQTVTFYKNNASQGSINLTDVGNEGYSVSCGSGSGSTNATANFGQDSTFSGATPAGGNTDANSIGTFKYAPPDGYLALCTANLPTPTVLDPSDNFNTVLYTGNNGNLNVTGVGFNPDFIWAKNRVSGSYHPDLYDTVRGNNLRLNSSQTAIEATGFLTFETDGFSLTQGGGINANNNAHVAWNWKAGGTPTATNSAGAGNAPTSGSVMIDGVASTTALNGDIPATKISANTKSGFSIVSYTGTGATNPTVNHGLTKTPEFIILKDRDSNSNNNQWNIWHKDAGDGDDYGYFTNAAFTGSAQVIGTDNNVFTLKPNLLTSNESGDNYIAYLFHSVEGYSKVGSYIGNSSADGPYVYTGFRPAWLLVKRASGGVGHWDIFDNKRETFNEMGNQLYASQATQEASNDHDIDFLSNGFKWRDASGSVNSSGTYIYLAIAESPFKNSNAR